VTVDFDTVGLGGNAETGAGKESDPALLNTVTVRDRDTLSQERVQISVLNAWIRSRLV
jgi:glycyl-tRNA synthetase